MAKRTRIEASDVLDTSSSPPEPAPPSAGSPGHVLAEKRQAEEMTARQHEETASKSPATASHKARIYALYKSQGVSDEQPILNIQGMVLRVGDLA